MTLLNNISKSFYINLDRRQDRRDHINSSLPFPAERFPAIDAHKVELNKEVKKLFPKTYSSRSKAEICCAISHYRLWQKLTMDKYSSNYLILEDDVVFKPGFVNFWNQEFSNHIPKDYNLIYLGGCQPWNKPHYHKALMSHNNYFYNVKKNDYFTKDDNFWHMNASSYILNKNAASLLCQWVEQNGMEDAVDNFMQKFFNANKLFSSPESVYHLNPLMAYQLHEANDNAEVDKNSDIRNSKERFVAFSKKQLEPKNVFYWNCSMGRGNVGDMLNIPVGKFLFGENTSFNQRNSGQLIYLIGSNLADVGDEDLACGVGLHHHTQKIESKNIQAKCVRGPLSLKTLNQEVDKPAECFLGDPALLLKLFHQPNLREGLVDKIGVVPHISNIDFFKKQVDQLDNFYLIDPTNFWEQVVSEIYSCKSIISSSLHGLICSDAYDKPNVWIKIPGQSIPPCDQNSDYGDFKYWDYLLSQGREIKFINHIKSNLPGKLYSGGNKIDLPKMFFAISGKKLIENNCFPNLKPIPSNQIPKKIHLSWKNKNILDSNYRLIKKGAKNLESLNPDWDIEVNDDEDVNRYIRDSIGKSSWKLIKDKKITEKTDLWRLLKIYKEGGLYIDIDRYIDTPLSEIINEKTSCVIPTFNDIDFSQDFVLSCADNPMIERAISNNLLNRKDGQNLFHTAVCSYMHAVSECLSGQQVDRGDNPDYFNDIRGQIQTCDHLETYRELGPENHILFRDINKQFNSKIFEEEKADFYNSESVVHWNQDNVNFNKQYAANKNLKDKSGQLKQGKINFIWQTPGGFNECFEKDWILELFKDFKINHIDDGEFYVLKDNSVVVYSDIYCDDLSIYNDKVHQSESRKKERRRQYFEKFNDRRSFLIHLSDEHRHAYISHYKYFDHVFRNYYREDAYLSNVTFFPLGYKKNFKA